MEFIHTVTKDNLILPGILYPADLNKPLFLFVHGMSDNWLENTFTHILGEKLQQQGYSFLYAHNRGYSHINDINTTKTNEWGHHQSNRVGVMYERFEDCLLDIDAWVKMASTLGYQKIILIGHSLGGPKVIHYLHKQNHPSIVGLVLASPGDMVGLITKPEYQPNYFELLTEAQDLVAKGQGTQLLSQLIWNDYNLSAQTFLDLFTENGPADNLPLLRNPTSFPELESVKVPTLCIISEHDDIIIRSITEDLNLYKTKAKNCPNFTPAILPRANHNYEGNELGLFEVIYNWAIAL